VLVDPHGDETAVAVESFISEADTLEPAKEREETKRLLYVAMTRARDSLYLSTLLKDGQFKPTPGSLGSVMPASMTVLFESAGRASHGARLHWTTTAAVSEAEATTPATSTVMRAAALGNVHEFVVVSHTRGGEESGASDAPVPGRVADEADESATSAERASAGSDDRPGVSGHVAVEGDAAEGRAPFAGSGQPDERRVDSGDAWPRVRVTGAGSGRGARGPGLAGGAEGATHALVGRLVHRLFQARVDPAGETEAIARQSLRLVRAEEHVGLESPEEVGRRAAAIFQRVASREDVRTLLTSGTCLYEVPFSLRASAERTGQAIVRGTIDALVQQPDGSIVVVEFKTGAAHVDHNEQLALYVEAARTLFPGATVKGQLIYP
jgi:ATP-dependent exoDNAse (exonuclease V) beta subunit